MAEQLAGYADEHHGFWVREQPFELRYIDPHPRLAQDLPDSAGRIRMWWRPTDSVPDDPALGNALLTHLTGTTVLGTAMTPRGAVPVYSFSALIDHALWFHRPVDLSDWVFGRSVWNASLIRNETAHTQTAIIWRCHHPFGRQASQQDPKLGANPHRPTLMSEMTYR